MTDSTCTCPGGADGWLDDFDPDHGIPGEGRLSRAEWLELLTYASTDPALPVGRRLWASWMAGEMVAATTVKAADLWKGATGA